jgi:steroid delta-isomerase-like uncharacterized protein
VAETTTAAPASGTAEAVARRYFDGVARRDLDAMAACWHADGVDDLVPIGILRGPDEVRAFFEELFAAVPDMDFTVTRVTAGERIAAVEWRFTGTFAGGPFQGIAPTGGHLEVRGVDCCEVEDGLIVRNTAYYDGAGFARSIGMLPEQGSAAERAMTSAFNALTRARGALRARSAR